MTLCSKCSCLDIASAWTQFQSIPETGQSSIESVNLEGWHSNGKAVFASEADCRLCELICRGWRSYRDFLVRQAISTVVFNPANPPEDLYDDVAEMSVYVDSSVEVSLTRRPRFTGSGYLQAWTPILVIECRPRGSVFSGDVHERLVAECRICRSGGAKNSVKDDNNGIGRPVPSDPISAESINTAKIWLETCLGEHHNCRSNSSQYTPPTRILDIDDGVDVDRIFLRDKAPEPGYQYVALSHCWGKGNQLCTTSATIETHRRGLMIDILPKTFKDAVRVVRALGLRYLWIDSLCIVQDDLEDWRREAGRMADIYRNAHFVLAASRSASDQEGFLDTRQAPVVVNLPSNPPGCEFSLNLQSSPVPDNARPFDGEPLNQRAWCLQERYLARRILYHCNEQMFWECAEMGAAEDGDFVPYTGDQISRIKRSAAISKTVFTEVPSYDEGSDDSSGDQASYFDWYKMVEDYTARDITKDSDRLPALHGLETVLARGTGDESICGIWRDGLLEGLAWCQANPDRPLTRPNTSNATSWSWTSVKGPVQFPIYTWHEQRAAWKGSICHFERLTRWHATSDYVHPSILSESEKPLRLEGQVVPIRGVQPRPRDPPASGSQFGIAPERSPVADRVFAFLIVDHEAGSKAYLAWLDGAFDVKGEEGNISVEDLSVLFLTRLPFVLEYDFMEHRFGLVLQRLHHPTLGDCYKRVGFIDGCVLFGGRPASPTESLAESIADVNDAQVLAFRRPQQEGDMSSRDLNKLAMNPFEVLAPQVITIL
jgi:hypothetical protein